MADNVTFNLFEDYPDIGQGNLFVETVTRTVKKVASQSTVQKSSTKKIEDFGEKIAGAKKDAYTAYQNMLRKAAQSEMKVQPLSKSFPKPNYQKLLEDGVAGWRVSAVRAIREFLSPKPNIHAWNLGRWARQATELRNIAVGILEDEISESELTAKLNETAYSENDFFAIKSTMAAYKELGHDYDFSAFDFVEYTDGKVGMKSKKISKWSDDYINLQADTLEELLQKFKEKMPLQKKPKKRNEKEILFYSYQWINNPNEHFIGTDFGKKTIEVEGPFATDKESWDYIVENRPKLEEKFAAMKQIPYERENENLPRSGEQKRDGDVTSEKFQETFGFRGVQFGNWVSNDRRQEDLNKTYDALLDMADVLNLPPKALSLNGQLGLAFGARGYGGKNPPLAHYEPAQVVINLTKNKGAGSLAHEWMHSLDNYFAKRMEMNGGMMTTNMSNQIQNKSNYPIFEDEEYEAAQSRVLKIYKEF